MPRVAVPRRSTSGGCGNSLRKTSVVSLLISDSIAAGSYDDCWAEALQYSAVYVTDLREWIEKWEKDGKVSVKGRKSASEVLKRDCGHLLCLRTTPPQRPDGTSAGEAVQTTSIRLPARESVL